MDSGLAAIIGASIGSAVTLLASVVTPWIRESHDRRREAKERRQEALFNGIRDVLVATGTLMFRSGSATIEHSIELHEALVALDLHLGANEYAISDLAVQTATLVRSSSAEAPAAIAAIQFILPRWRSGQMKIGEVRATFAKLTGISVSESKVS